MSDINITIGNEGDINVVLDGISTFQALTDTPTSYTGETGKFVKVNSGEDGLEFGTPSASVAWGEITGTLSSQTDLQTTLDAKEDDLTFSTGLTRTGDTITVNNSEISIPASQVTDFDTEVANNSAVTLNTAKVTNATHTGEVTGSGSLTITDNIVDEANLKVSNSPTSGYFLQYKDITDQLTWAANGSGTVTSVDAGDGMNFSSITSTGDVIMGTPGTTTSSSTNAVTNTSHTHQLDESGISITASQVSDFDTEVSNNTDVTANTSKVTNATHTGDVTGSAALAIGVDKVLDSHINWGTGATQVNTADVPELTNLYYTEARVSANTDVTASTAHISSNGSSHSYIDQSVISGATPTFTGTNFSGIPANALPDADDDGTTKGVSTYDNTDFNAASGVITIEDSGIDHNSLTNTHNLSSDIDHTTITNIGSNSHTQIDSHISSTTNPHSVDIDDVTPTTNKGDIIVEDGNNAIRLAVGTNTHVLTANSSTGTGLEWVSPGAPAAHASTHENDGADEISIAGLDGEPVELTTHIANTSSIHGVTGEIVGTTDIQTLTNKTLTTPTIGDFTNSVHDHADNTGGGTIDHTDLTAIGSNTHAQIDTHIGNTSSVHGVTGAVVGDTDTQTLTNKTINTTSNTITITASDVSDFDTEVANNTDVAANTTHRGLTNNPHAVDATDVSLGNVTNVATDDTAYNATSWDANTDAATKNAIRDKIETMDTAIGLNTAKDTNVTTNLSEGTSTETTVDVNSSDGTNATLVSASTSRAGLLTKAKFDEIVANTSAKHTQGTDTALGTMTEDINMNSSYQVVGLQAPAATGEAIRQTTNVTETNLNTLTGGGDTTLHDHDGISENTAARHTQNTDTALGSGAVAADHGTAATDQIINVSYGTSATPPTASTTTEGSLYIQYTA